MYYRDDAMFKAFGYMALGILIVGIEVMCLNYLFDAMMVGDVWAMVEGYLYVALWPLVYIKICWRDA